MFSRNKMGIVLLFFCGLLACGPSDGAFVSHYPDGKVKEEGFYKNNNKTGPWRFYWKDGTKKVDGVYQNDEPHGEWTFYDESGRSIGKGI
jgi:antitoxin component YwqK of YwqJK toxin-antitoxin module